MWSPILRGVGGAIFVLSCCAASLSAAEPQVIRLPAIEDSAPPAATAQAAPAPLERRDDVVELASTDETPSDAQRLSELEERFEQWTKEFKPPALPKVEKKEEFPTYKFTGFTQLDTAFYSQDENNIDTVGDAQNGTGFRRARFAMNGRVAERTGYQLEVDFATAGRPSFFDCWVDQTEVPFFNSVKIGQFCQPFSLDALTGFRNLTFLERSLPFLAFVPFRRVGIESQNLSEDEMTQWHYSAFRTGGFNNAPLGDDRFATDFGDVGGYSFSTRATHLIYYDPLVPDRYLWHIGASYDYSQLGANTAIGSGTPGNAGLPEPFYQSRTPPEFALGYPELSQSFGSAVNGTPNFVDSGRYAANNFNMWGVETLYQAGPWGAQSEFIGVMVDSAVGPIFYHGAYAQVGYRLTGEHRVYEKRNGVLGKLVPYTNFISFKRDGVQGWGAWEVAFRWSYVDIQNPADLDGHYYNAATNTFTGTANAGNGVMNDSTVGINWYLNTHFKMQFNWIHAMLDNDLKGWSEADLFVSRVQVDF